MQLHQHRYLEGGSGTPALISLAYEGLAGGRGPRVCILGGGFGGLYTAVRLESLLWPPGSKPQARGASSLLKMHIPSEILLGIFSTYERFPALLSLSASAAAFVLASEPL